MHLVRVQIFHQDIHDNDESSPYRKMFGSCTQCTGCLFVDLNTFLSRTERL